MVLKTFENEYINIVDSNLILRFDYHNCNYDVIIQATDTYYLPNESNIKLAIRKAFLRLADHNLVYEKRAKRIKRKKRLIL